MDVKEYFMQYQIDWLRDKSPVKIWQKSRRIGATYVQSFEDVYDILTNKDIPTVWFSSADISAAKEYILYCAQWAKIIDAGARDLGEAVLESEKDVKGFQITFANGKRIIALSSNPKAFRSKGGKVVLDEFAHHEDAVALWKAAKPSVTWGYPLRILSTHNGKNALFYKFIERIEKGKLQWSLHTTDIFRAANDGLVAKVLRLNGRKATDTEISQWLKAQEADCFDNTTWLEEFCCIPVDEASAFMSYEKIASCESDTALWDDGASPEVLGSLYIGMDVARKHDLTVIWIIEKLGDMCYTRKVITLKNMKFSDQKEILYGWLKHPKMRRCCIDKTGLGMQLAEEAEQLFGKLRIEGVMFTATIKEEMAYKLNSAMEDKAFIIPADHDVREDFHSIRKVSTSSGNIRFDVAKSDTHGHADRFWAAALAKFATEDGSGPVFIVSKKVRPVSGILRGY
jgi:phage FluMu gp28-like protein